MSTISPSLQIGGVNGWKGKEGAVLGWQQTSGGLFKPAKFDFTRLSGSASYVDENGLIQIEHRPNYPRFTWKDGKQCLMQEDQSTNELPNIFASEYSSGAMSAPTNDGQFEYFPEAEWALFQQSDVSQNYGFSRSPSSGTQWAISVFVDTNQTPDFLAIREVGNGVGIFQISNESVFQAGGGLSGGYVESYSDNIKRVTIYGTSASGGNQFFVGTDANGSVTTNDGSTYRLAGLQYEEGRQTSTSLIWRDSADGPVTRAAEFAKGLNLGNFLGDSQGGLYLEGLNFDTVNDDYLSISDGSTANRIYFRNRSFYRVQYFESSIEQADITGGSISENTFYKTAFSYEENNLQLFAGGSNLAEDLSVNIFSDGTLTRLALDRGDGSNPFRGLIHEIRAYDQRPTNSQLESDTQ